MITLCFSKFLISSGVIISVVVADTLSMSSSSMCTHIMRIPLPRIVRIMLSIAAINRMGRRINVLRIISVVVQNGKSAGRTSIIVRATTRMVIIRITYYDKVSVITVIGVVMLRGPATLALTNGRITSRMLTLVCEAITTMRMNIRIPSRTHELVRIIHA